MLKTEYQKMKLQDQKINFSQKYRNIEKLFDEDNKNEIDILYNKIEDILIIQNIKNFRLSVKNSYTVEIKN